MLNLRMVAEGGVGMGQSLSPGRALPTPRRKATRKAVRMREQAAASATKLMYHWHVEYTALTPTATERSDRAGTVVTLRIT
jgi:hypothetical protein